MYQYWLTVTNVPKGFSTQFWCEFFPQATNSSTQQGVLQHNSLLTPPGESIRSYRLRAQSHKTAPCRTSVPSPGGHLCLWQTGYRPEVQLTPPSSGSINLLEWLTELGETFYFLDHWFTIKGYNSGRARWKRCRGQSTRTGQGISMPSLGVPLSPNQSPRVHQHRSHQNPILLGFYGGI